ncbi:FixH family protein [Chryseobacterium sp.]|uniref:FixH family protein n=1 Tax=Chryseobacterium sp. TaxID=1871047 RepID=UPI0011C7A3B7|nr:FixH family protein [Chryseobacterium sp.]TXF76160.1 nitrogen fixation protein FixH [Chryseobacterium sp.]
MFKKFSWGHGIILALGLFIAFILFLIFFFANGMKNSELVSDNYYQDELAYQEVIDAKHNAEKISVKPAYSQLPEGIRITFPESIKVDGQKVSFTLFRTDDSNLDLKKEVTLNAQKSFLIPKKVIFSGSYTLKVRWYENKKPYQLDYDVLWK